MIEARITCTCRSVRINDLGNRMLSQGESITVDEASARKSVDLAQLKQAGGVRVEYIKTPDMRPAPTNGHVVNKTPAPGRIPAPAPIDMVMLLQQQLEAIRRELPGLVDKAVAKAFAERDREKHKAEEIGPRKSRKG